MQSALIRKLVLPMMTEFTSEAAETKRRIVGEWMILSASKKVRLSSFQQKYKEFCEPKVREYEAKYRKNVMAIEAALRESRCDVLVPPFPSFHDRLARCRRSPACRRSSGSC